MLINCTLYKEGIKQKTLSLEEIPEWHNKPGYILWAAFYGVDFEELATVQNIFQLNDLSIEDNNQSSTVADFSQVPRIVEYQNLIFIMAHLLEYKNNNIEVGEMKLYVGKNFILSFRKFSEHKFNNVRERCEQEPELLKLGVGYILYAIIDEIVDRYFPLINKIEMEMESIEKDIFKNRDTKKLIERLYQLKLQSSDLRHATLPLSEVLGKFHGGRVPAISINLQDYFNDIHYHILRINKSIDNLRDSITTSIQVTLALSNIEKSEITKKLAGWAAIFGVCTTGVGIWGMNFKYMPELEFKYGYPLSLIIIFGAAYIMYKKFKKSKWL